MTAHGQPSRMLLSGIVRGGLGGAAGASLLNAVTYADMAVRGRPASSTPEDTVEAAADRLDVAIPGDGDERGNRVEAVGALQGLASGIGVGAAFGWLHDRGLKVNKAVGTVLVAATSMALSDLSMQRLGVTDLQTWSTRDWVSDVVPHLAYGWATVSVIHAADSR